ncbi:helix-turn-helix transcriptional regulator [Apibacter raozihei]|uniref:helix-turn-helix domain-containing protein n=1 Tax=Apibacter raozihei TaxID=2500547 RepID=UPI000FE38DB3|nr:helix-turn-helix transcriptional regulator [Apibacter raozihei]
MKYINSFQDIPVEVDFADMKQLKTSNNSFDGQFNIFPRWRCNGTYLRRDFFKLVLVKGSGILRYAEKEFNIIDSAIFLANPRIPYSWTPISEVQEGWICMFSQEFVCKNIDNDKFLPLLNSISNPVFFMNENELEYMNTIFKKIVMEMSSEYLYKTEIIRNYLHLIIHELQKLRPQANIDLFRIDASKRLTYQFLELLEYQFPLDSPEMTLELRAPKDFASKLSVHVNHLNYSLKKNTGKTSRHLITDSLIRESMALLKNTDWTISEIAYSLGFEYPSHFTNFVKKHTKSTPKEIRFPTL